MSQLSQAFGKKFDKDAVRTKTFEYNGHTFQVKIPLTVEYENLFANVQDVSDEKVKQYYDELTKEFIKNKDDLDPELGVIIKDNDIEIQGRSMMETAKSKAITENRILAMIRLLVPEDKQFDMSVITYEMVEELFPFSVQLELVELIGKTISPNYKDQKGK
jgi:6-pyruvoyl-tetrahydropterin synthase